ncbi:MAG TPA: hypothetical protein VMR18_02745 [Candidatus Saccharimonadales bacterium]|nr:hypothetical protein [Candidatus Saccharimonadales bacterium]
MSMTEGLEAGAERHEEDEYLDFGNDVRTIVDLLVKNDDGLEGMDAYAEEAIIPDLVISWALTKKRHYPVRVAIARALATSEHSTTRALLADNVMDFVTSGDEADPLVAAVGDMLVNDSNPSIRGEAELLRRYGMLMLQHAAPDQ